MWFSVLCLCLTLRLMDIKSGSVSAMERLTEAAEEEDLDKTRPSGPFHQPLQPQAPTKIGTYQRLESEAPSSPPSVEGAMTTRIAIVSTSRSQKRDVPTKSMAELARENVLSMKSNTVRCSQPRPKVIKVQDYHPHAYKRYVPSCIVLHRCDRDTGCCDEQGAVCSVKRRKRVTLYFYVVSLGSRNGVTGPESAGQIEALRFFNHTECVCRRRKKSFMQTEKPRDMERTSSAVTFQVPYWLTGIMFLFWVVNGSCNASLR